MLITSMLSTSTKADEESELRQQQAYSQPTRWVFIQMFSNVDDTYPAVHDSWTI